MRNREPIREALQSIVGKVSAAEAHDRALEIASGTGCHLEVLAPAFPHLRWQPSEYIPPAELRPDESGKIGERAGLRELELIDTYGCKLSPNVEAAVALDASEPWARWPEAVRAAEGQYALVYLSNVLHISPFACTKGLMAGAAHALRDGGALVTYGPFKLDGAFTSDSNAAFDTSLRARNPEWGYRDVEEVAAEARAEGLQLVERRDMPANNFLLLFLKQPPAEAGL